jgi:tetratricopeptide (TPR) repeat protein
LARLSVDHDNLRAALTWAIEQADDDIALGLVAAGWGWFWYRRGYWSEGRAWLERVSSLVGGGDRSPTYSYFLFIRGFLAQLQGDTAFGQDLLEESLVLSRQLGDSSAVNTVLLNMGVAAREKGDAERATALLEESLQINQQQQHAESIAWSRVSLGAVAVLREDVPGAAALLKEALAGFRAVGADAGAAWALNHLGHVAHLQGEYAHAANLYRESLTLFSGTDQQGVGWSVEGLGELALAQGALAEAGGHYEESLRIFRELGDPAIVWSIAGLGCVAAMSARPERAARLWGAAAAMRDAQVKRVAPTSRVAYEEAQRLARAALGDDAFAAAWAAGRALGLDAAVAEALAAAG